MNKFIKDLKSVVGKGMRDEEVVEHAKKSLAELTGFEGIGNAELDWRLGQELIDSDNASRFIRETLMDTTGKKLRTEVSPTIIAIAILINTPVAQFKE